MPGLRGSYSVQVRVTAMAEGPVIMPYFFCFSL